MNHFWNAPPARREAKFRRTQRRRLLSVVIPLVFVGFGVFGETPTRALILPVELRLVSQNFNISQSSNVRLVVQIVDDSTRTAITTDRTVTFRIIAGRRISTRQSVVDIGTGSTTVKQVSFLDIPISQTTQSLGGNFTLSIPTTSSPRRDALLIEALGIYPLNVQIIQSGGVVGQFATFINMFDPSVTYSRMPVSIAVSVTSQPTLQPDGSTDVPDGARTQLTRLADLLEVNAAPISVQVQPELLEGLVRSRVVGDSELLTRLRSRFQFQDVLSTTYVSFDPSSSQRSSMNLEFADQLRQGEDIIDTNDGDAVPTHRTWLSRVTVDNDGASLLSDFGVQSLVLLPQAAAPLGSFDNYARAYRVNLTSRGTSGQVTLFISDPSYAQKMSGAHENPVLDAYRIAAEVIAERDEVVAANGDPAVRHKVLSTNTGDVQDPILMGRLAVALDHAPQLVLTGLSDVQIVGIETTAVDLPRTARVDLINTKDKLATLLREIQSTSTMLSSDSPQLLEWPALVAVASSDTLSSDDFDRYVAAIRSKMRALRTSIKVPESITFTLTGKESNLRLQIHNTALQALTVVVDLVSAKLQFPFGSQLVTIPSESAYDLVVPVVARANGTFPIEVVLHTPDGSTQVGKRIQLSARVRALAGLGQLVTGTAVLILIVWWATHGRRKRRHESMGKHPAVR